ncbi:hypothetical protein NF681_05035 [Comamonadaceae bacterium OTU4NAUVB1]|nr:hypothetical protein NF681_05035 [Comamonadaceae bacterium OTU4NAUVB1]
MTASLVYKIEDLSLMPVRNSRSSTEPSLAQQTDLELLRGSAFFNSSFYLALYSDVAAAGLDPEQHYLQHGAIEGRDPSPSFSTLGYLTLYPDVAASGTNPLIHFIKHGIFEGRDPGISNAHQSISPSATSLDPHPVDFSSAEISTEEEDLVRKSTFFDDNYYLTSNPDVAAHGIDAVKHYLEWGAAEGRDPSESFSNSGYLKKYPDVAAAKLNPLVHFLQHGRSEGRTAPSAKPLFPSIFDLYEIRWPALRPLPVFSIPASVLRVNIVTDSVAPSSLFGGVGTSIILGTLLANRLNATLRLITQHEQPDATVLNSILSSNSLSLENSFEVAFAPNSGQMQVPVTNLDIFLTTSWWSTRAVLEAVPRKQIAYLLQEDERMFYPFGDDRLLCSETLGEDEIPIVVNTQLLLDHLTGGPDAYDFKGRAIAFEPAFPSAGTLGVSRNPDSKKKFFFYARPNNYRNLFWRGATALAQAIRIGILDPEEWEFYWVGKDTPKCTLPRGVRPTLVEGMDWATYQEFVAKMDAAFVLMDTPHPSYPPFDLAGAGVAVLTNKHGIKQDLSNYSKNILTCDLDEKSLLDGLSRVTSLGGNAILRKSNSSEDSISRDWGKSLGKVVEHLANHFSMEQ